MNKAFCNKIEVIAVVGPTASGKSSFAIEFAKKNNGEIVSADSRLVYRGFDIGTAKPTKEEREEVPHYLVDIIDPENDYSVGQYCKDAKKVISDINAKGKVPIIVGGTGLYIDALLKGFEFPAAVSDYELRSKLKTMDKTDLYDMLKNLDNNAVTSIDINDKKKIIRAIEIVKNTGKSLNNSRGVSRIPYNVRWIGKNFPREILYQRINSRVDEMIKAGLVDETKLLLKKHGRCPNLVNTIGYREILGYIDNRYSLDEAVELLKKNTRNYAKRQLTWFRRNPEIEWDIYPEKLKK